MLVVSFKIYDKTEGKESVLLRSILNEQRPLLVEIKLESYHQHGRHGFQWSAAALRNKLWPHM